MMMDSAPSKPADRLDELPAQDRAKPDTKPDTKQDTKQDTKSGTRSGTKAAVKPGNPSPPIPPELLAELRKDVLANRLFERMSPSHRREYVRWISDAKRETTRLSRAEKAIALILSKGDESGEAGT